MATEYLFSNNATTTLAQSVSATATVINVAEGTGRLFPSPSSGQAFAVTLVDAATGLTNEICYCTSRSGDQLTVIRGQEGTNAVAWSAGDTCANYITADVLTSWQQYLSEYLTQPQADERYLRLEDSNNQTVDSPVTFSGKTLVPSVTDWSQKQAIPASDADARYMKLTDAPFVDANLRFQVIQATVSYMTKVTWPKAFASTPVFITASIVWSGRYYPRFVYNEVPTDSFCVFSVQDFPPDSSNPYVGKTGRYTDYTINILVGGYF